MMKPIITVFILFLTIFSAEVYSQVDRDSIFTLAKQLQLSGYEKLISDQYEQSVKDLIGSKKLFSSIRDFENSLYNDIYLSDNYYKTGDISRALEILDSTANYPDSVRMPHSSLVLFQKALIYYSQEKYHTTIQLLDSLVANEKSDSLYKLRYQQRVYGTKAKCCIALGNISEALAYYKAALHSTFASKYDSVDLAGTYLNMGTLYYFQRKYDHALCCLDTAEVLYRKTLPDTWRHISNIYNLKAIIKNNTNDPLLAIEYLRTIINTRPENTIRSKLQLSWAYYNLAISHYLLDNLDSAIHYLESCRILNVELNQPNTYLPYKLLGKYYQEKEEYIQASHYYELALIATRDGPDQETKANYETIIEYLGFLLSTNNSEGADEYISIIEKCIEQSKLDQGLQLKYYLGIGNHFFTIEENYQALRHLLIADSLLSNIIPPGAVYASIDPDYIKLYTYLAVLNARLAKEDSVSESKDLYIDQFKHYAKNAMGLIKQSEDLLYEFNSKVYAAHRSHDNTNMLIKNWISLKPYIEKDAFESLLIKLLSGKKAIVSNSQIDKRNRDNLNIFADSLLQIEVSMRAQLTTAYKELNLPTGLASIESNYDQISYSELAIRYDSLIHSITSTYPEFITLNQRLSDDEIRARINDQTILDYYLIDSLLVVRVIDRAESFIYLHKLPDDFNRMNNRINSFLHKSSSHNVDKDMFNGFVSDSYSLYKILIGVIQDQINGRRLVIIPDKEIAKVSFDVLLTDTTESGCDFRTLPYLLNEYPISYQFSIANFLYQDSPGTGEGYLSVTPSENADAYQKTSEPLLARSSFETNVINEERLMPVSSIVGAGDTTLQKLLQSNQVIHFAVHGTGDTSNPLLSSLKLGGSGMTDIYTIDILNSRLNADLVILSACNTGLGRNLQNEGIYSIGKAFLVAGSKSALMTTMEIEDHVAETIVTSYIQYIQEGLPKDVALQKAKLEFLSGCSPQLSHPLYWSSFVQYGNTDPIISHKRNLPVMVTITIAIILSITVVVVLVLMKRRKRII